MCGSIWVPCATQLPILPQLWLQAVPRKAEMQGATSWVGRVDLEANQVNAKALNHYSIEIWRKETLKSCLGFSFSKARHITKSGRSSIKALAGHVKMFARVSPKVCSYDEHRKKRIQKYTETIHMNIQYIQYIATHTVYTIYTICSNRSLAKLRSTNPYDNPRTLHNFAPGTKIARFKTRLNRSNNGKHENQMIIYINI